MTKFQRQFRRGQKVMTLAVDPRWNEEATICRYESGPLFAGGEHVPGWYVVRYARGGGGCIHESQLRPVTVGEDGA